MAAAAAEIFNHQMTTAQAFAGKSATPMDSSTNGASGTNSTSNSDGGSDNGATISANDFLTLLVTEMQNQDPTADTDPNEYIDQLVQVNSLEQLIDINQTLTTDLGSTASGTSGSSDPLTTGAASDPTGTGTAHITSAVHGTAHTAKGSSMAQMTPAAGNASAIPNSLVQRTAGNLSVPGVNRSAQRVAHALDGRTRTQQTAGSNAS